MSTGSEFQSQSLETLLKAPICFLFDLTCFLFLREFSQSGAMVCASPSAAGLPLV